MILIMRERLIEVLNDILKPTVENVADAIIADGWIRPPCKVGDKLYIIAAVSGEIVECVVKGMWLFEQSFSLITDSGTIINSSFGKTVFLTKEEAEQALKGGE